MLTTEFDQFADVVPPQRPGDPHRGGIEAIVHRLARPAVQCASENIVAFWNWGEEKWEGNNRPRFLFKQH